MIDVFRDELLTFKQAAAIIPGRPHFGTVHRWARDGVRGHVLQTVLVGGTRYTTRSAINEFITTSSTPAVDTRRLPKPQPKRRGKARA